MRKGRGMLEEAGVADVALHVVHAIKQLCLHITSRTHPPHLHTCTTVQFLPACLSALTGRDKPSHTFFHTSTPTGAPCLPQCPDRAGCARRDGERLPRTPRQRVCGTSPQVGGRRGEGRCGEASTISASSSRASLCVVTPLGTSPDIPEILNCLLPSLPDSLACAWAWSKRT